MFADNGYVPDTTVASKLKQLGVDITDPGLLEIAAKVKPMTVAEAMQQLNKLTPQQVAEAFQTIAQTRPK